MTTKDYILSAIKTNRQTLMRLGIRNVGLFGSYSRNEQSVKSDIDILIEFISVTSTGITKEEFMNDEMLKRAMQ